MTRMTYLSMVAIVANVRPDGAAGEFRRRAFDLMLDPSESQEKMLKEARRILRQIGYETRGVAFERPPGN